jgi:hypothetical protein
MKKQISMPICSIFDVETLFCIVLKIFKFESTFVQGAKALSVDDGLVDENVLGAISGADEAETLLGVEKPKNVSTIQQNSQRNF